MISSGMTIRRRGARRLAGSAMRRRSATDEMTFTSESGSGAGRPPGRRIRLSIADLSRDHDCIELVVETAPGEIDPVYVWWSIGQEPEAKGSAERTHSLPSARA